MDEKKKDFGGRTGTNTGKKKKMEKKWRFLFYWKNKTFSAYGKFNKPIYSDSIYTLFSSGRKKVKGREIGAREYGEKSIVVHVSIRSSSCCDNELVLVREEVPLPVTGCFLGASGKLDMRIVSGGFETCADDSGSS